MKIIHTSDWHIGKILNDYSLLEDQAIFLDWFINQMQQIRPDVILIAGDLYDRSIPSSEAVRLLSSALGRLITQLKCPVIINAGNHDSRDRLAFGNSILEQSNLFMISKVETTVKKITFSDQFGPVHFYVLPYLDVYDIKALFPEEKLQTPEQAFLYYSQHLHRQVNFDERNVFMAHGFFSASSHTIHHSELSSDKQVAGDQMLDLSALTEFDYIALGHLHGKRSAGANHIRYSGSPLKYSIDERQQKKGFYLLELLNKGLLSISEISIPARRDVRLLEGYFADILSAEKSEQDHSDDYIMVSLLDRLPIKDAMTRLKSRYPNILGVRFPSYHSNLFEKQTAFNTVKQQSLEQLFSDFYLKNTGEALTAQQQVILQRNLNGLGDEPN